MSKHLKRLNAPKVLKIARKEDPWIVRPRSGPHSVEKSIALTVAIRDVLNLADKAREAKRIVTGKNVKIDGKIITDHKYPVGFMDVVYIKNVEKYYRVLYDTKGRLRFLEISKDDAAWKLVRIEHKTTVSGSKIQIGLHDGKNILLDQNQYKAGDVLKVKLPEYEVLEHYPFKSGCYALTIGGLNIGKIARIEEYIELKSGATNKVTFKEGFESTIDNVFVIGVTRAEVQVPEVSINE